MPQIFRYIMSSDTSQILKHFTTELKSVLEFMPKHCGILGSGYSVVCTAACITSAAARHQEAHALILAPVLLQDAGAHLPQLTQHVCQLDHNVLTTDTESGSDQLDFSSFSIGMAFTSEQARSELLATGSSSTTSCSNCGLDLVTISVYSFATWLEGL